ELAPGMAQPDRGLAGVDACTEHIDLEPRLQLAEVRGRRRSHAEASLADAGEGAVVLAKLLVERGQLGHPHRVEPARVDLLEVLADIDHREAVDLERWLVGRRR